MRRCKILASVLMGVLMILLSVGCYMVNGQRMWYVKGTYELISYSRTSGKTSEVTNYITQDGYKAFLVVTGNGEGYYVHSDNETEPYARKVSLFYTYEEADSKKVEYVTYRFEDGEEQKLGVTREALNYAKPAIKLNEMMYTDGINISWKRVSRDVDLSYVEEQLGTISME